MEFMRQKKNLLPFLLSRFLNSQPFEDHRGNMPSIPVGRAE
jgi:hypothetical protein